MPVGKMCDEPVLLLQPPPLLIHNATDPTLLAQQRPLHLREDKVVVKLTKVTPLTTTTYYERKMIAETENFHRPYHVLQQQHDHHNHPGHLFKPLVELDQLAVQ